MSEETPRYDTMLARLREIVGRLEGDTLPLEEGVELFREGMELAKSCRERLARARNEVRILSEGALREFETGEEDEHDGCDG